MTARQHRGGPRLLITDRETAVYLERARVQVEGGRVVYHTVDDERRRSFSIPHVNLAVLFLGQGTSVTQDAARLLAEEGVYLAFTGTGATPLHLGSLTTYQATRHFRDLLPIYLDQEKSLAAAKVVMRTRAEMMAERGGKQARKQMKARDISGLEKRCKRFLNEMEPSTTIQELLGHEGSFSKACYHEFAKLSKLDKKTEEPFLRRAGEGNTADPLGRINALIDHGNYLCYGVAGAALWALGIPPHMSIFHGKTRAGGLVFDLADAFKDAYVLPFAFAAKIDAPAKEVEDTFRTNLINAFDDGKLLAFAIETLEKMLEVGENP